MKLLGRTDWARGVKAIRLTTTPDQSDQLTPTTAAATSSKKPKVSALLVSATFWEKSCRPNRASPPWASAPSTAASTEKMKPKNRKRPTTPSRVRGAPSRARSHWMSLRIPATPMQAARSAISTMRPSGRVGGRTIRAKTTPGHRMPTPHATGAHTRRGLAPVDAAGEKVSHRVGDGVSPR